VEYLFHKKISLLSLTDHDNSVAFDAIANGSYRLRPCYDIEVSADKRYLVVHGNNHALVMLRSVEKHTKDGEIGIHGYFGRLPEKREPVKDTIHRVRDLGAYVVINHPFFWEGIGYKGKIEEAINAGAVAFEKNAMEILFQIFDPVRSERLAREYNVSLVAAGDAHMLELYCRAGLTFDDAVYEQELIKNSRNHADAIKKLVTAGKFSTYFNYAPFRKLVKMAYSTKAL
jgi:hypothetical protein